ncbi:MAG: hypothetical protein K0R21_2116, partial [Anaerocolumna sp.]|nr:hypothetical protein [Anaerocolumna sp.]
MKMTKIKLFLSVIMAFVILFTISHQ